MFLDLCLGLQSFEDVLDFLILSAEHVNKLRSLCAFLNVLSSC